MLMRERESKGRPVPSWVLAFVLLLSHWKQTWLLSTTRDGEERGKAKLVGQHKKNLLVWTHAGTLCCRGLNQFCLAASLFLKASVTKYHTHRLSSLTPQQCRRWTAVSSFGSCRVYQFINSSVSAFRNERARWISALGQNINNNKCQDRTSKPPTTTTTLDTLTLNFF